MIQGKGNLDRDYLTQDFKNRLLIAAEQTKKKKDKSNSQVDKTKDQINDKAKEDTQDDKAREVARANLERLYSKR